MHIIIGVDIGTSGTKAIAFTSEGRVTGNAYMSYNPVVSPPGHHELDPEVLFNAVTTCIEKVVKHVKALQYTIDGISFSAAMHSLIAVDKTGSPLTNVLTWADARSTAYAEALKRTTAGNDIYRHTGTPVHPMSPLCKIMWIGENQPEIFKATHKFISIKEFIFYRFFDQYLIDHSIASSTGLFDIYKKAWFTPALAAAGITADHLSQPIFTTQIIKGLKNEYAEQLGIGAETPFIIGASDGCLANLGSNATQPGDMSVTIGTSGAVRMTTTQPAYDQQERIFNYILRDDLYVSGGAINNGVVLLKWYSEHFLHKPFSNASDLASFVQQAAEAPAGADGLIFLPYILGERAPVWDASARGVFFGIHAGHTQAHFMRAIIEGINYALYQVAASVDETVDAVQHIYASGGFINSPLWLQWITDVFGKEIKVITNEDASSVGAAILGWQSLGMLNDSETAAFFHIQQQYQPDLTLHASYQRYYAVYAGLYNKLKDDFQTLNNIRAEA
jgi:gluconokinase